MAERQTKKTSKTSGGGKGDIHAAARSGDLTAVQSILASDPLAVNSRDKHSRTPLHLAAWAGHEQVVSYLCKQKADVGAAAMDNMGAIHFAAQKGHLEAVRALVQAGASVKTCTRKGLTPLHYAVQGSHLELVKYLVKKGGVGLDMKTKAGKTVLDLAVDNQEVRAFLEESEVSSAKEGTNAEGKLENMDAEDKPENIDAEAAKSNDDEEMEEGSKRKGGADGEDDEEAQAAPSVAKKPRITLNHLVTEDDTQEE
ncbi:Putative ankyrin repeat protein RF_0381 [Linum grandiflorum]